MYISKELAEISTRMNAEIKTVEQALSELPSGRLACETQHGKAHFVKEDYVNHARKRRNLNGDDAELWQLIKKYIYSQYSTQLQQNAGAIAQAIKGVKDFDIAHATYELQRKMPLLTDEMISKALSDDSKDDWASAPYNKSTYQDDTTKWQISSFGLRLRSKSELLIAETLHKSGIQFHYEEVLKLGDSTLVPDFTIKRSDGKLIYWEHEGLTNSQTYLSRQIKKSQIYAMNNIVPWDNLIVTYDNADGIIDLRIVESEIKIKLLC